MIFSKECIDSIVIQYFKGDGDVEDAKFHVALMINYRITRNNIHELPESRLKAIAEKYIELSLEYKFSLAPGIISDVPKARIEELIGRSVAPYEDFNAIEDVWRRIDITEKVSLEKLEKGEL